MVVFTWSVYNGAVFYIDVFGTRFQKEVDQLKREVARYQIMSPEMGAKTPGVEGQEGKQLEALSLGASANDIVGAQAASSTGVDKSPSNLNGVRERGRAES